MKKLFTLALAFLFSSGFSQTATNFNVNDCSGNSHDLFSELNSGKVIVLCWVMPCSACIAPSLSAYTQVQNYQSSNPNKVFFYLVDDYANTTCPTLSSWALTNGMPNATVFSNAAIDMNDYGTSGMPKIVVLGGAAHQVFDNQDNTLNVTQFTNAINQALLASAIGINEVGTNNFSFSVYPNPVKGDKFTISNNASLNSNATIELYNLLGTRLKTFNITNQVNGKNEFLLDPDMKNGVYLVKVTLNSLTYTSKLVVNNQ